MKRIPILALTLALLPVSAALEAQRPPCAPCAGIRTDDPAAFARSLAQEPRIEGEARLYVAWDAELGATAQGTSQGASPASALEAVVEAGGIPWLRLVFRTPAPVLEHADTLAQELEAAAALARGAVDRTHFQILWQPASGSFGAEDFGAEDYAYLLKRASVSVTGAKGDARVITAPLAADPELLEALYGEEIAAYVDGVALEPAAPGALAAATAKVSELDPGRAIVVDAAPWPADPHGVLADAARNHAAGASVTLFEAPAGGLDAEALKPAKMLAREFQGDLSLDPTSAPSGGAEAWSFVRGEDLSLRVIVAAEPGAQSGDESLSLLFPDPQLTRPARLDSDTGEAYDLFGQTRSADGLTVEVPDATPVTLLRLERMTAAEIEGLEGLEEEVTVADERQMPVEEILRRLQAFEDAQNRRIDNYRALNTTHLRFQLSSGVQGLEVTFEGDYFYRQGEGFDWAWQTVFINGVRWRGKKIPNIPLVQPEKAAALPLEITFTKEYRYRLRGTDVVEGRDCWVVDFSPAVDPEPGKSLYRGTVWVDREHFGRVKTQALQLGLEGEVLSNEETAFFSPLTPKGEPGAWTPDNLWLPTRTVGQQLWSVLNATTVVEREVLLKGLEINPSNFEEQRSAVLASEATMVRDTEEGLRYLVPDGETGERIVEENVRPNQLFLLGGVFWDESLDYPLPLAGINFFSFDWRGTGKQVNLFFAGALAIGNVAEPELFGSKWDAGANLFAFAINTSDTLFQNGEEVEEEEIESRNGRVSLFLGRPIGSFGKVDFTYSLGRVDYSDADDTADGFVLPQDHFLHSLETEATYTRSGYRLRAAGSVNRRSEWQAWGLPGGDLDTFDPDTEEFRLWEASFAKTWWLPKFQRISFEAEYLDGENLDRFSKYEFGFFADTRIHGYRDDAVRAERAYAAHLSYGFEVGELLRLSAIGDVAWATDEATGLDNELLAGFGVEGSFIGPWETIVNLDVGVALDGPDDGVAVFLTLLKLFR